MASSSSRSRNELQEASPGRGQRRAILPLVGGHNVLAKAEGQVAQHLPTHVDQIEPIGIDIAEFIGTVQQLVPSLGQPRIVVRRRRGN